MSQFTGAAATAVDQAAAYTAAILSALDLSKPEDTTPNPK